MLKSFLHDSFYEDNFLTQNRQVVANTPNSHVKLRHKTLENLIDIWL